MIGFWVEPLYLNLLFLAPIMLLAGVWWQWHRLRQSQDSGRRRITTLISLTLQSLGTFIYILAPAIYPCNSDGCSGPEEFYASGIFLGLILALASVLLAGFTTKGLRLSIASCALLQLGIWFLIAVIWGG